MVSTPSRGVLGSLRTTYLTSGHYALCHHHPQLGRGLQGTHSPGEEIRLAWKSNKTDGTRLVEQKQAETLDKARHTASKKGLQVFMKDAHFSEGLRMGRPEFPLPSTSSSSGLTKSPAQPMVVTSADRDHEQGLRKSRTRVRSPWRGWLGHASGERAAERGLVPEWTRCARSEVTVTRT